MNGYMSEATQGFATLEDVDAGTFARVSRWMYSGDYAAAEYTEPCDSPALETPRSFNFGSAANQTVPPVRNSGTVPVAGPGSAYLSLGARNPALAQIPHDESGRRNLGGFRFSAPPPSPFGVYGSPLLNDNNGSQSSLKEIFHELQYTVPDASHIPPRPNKVHSEDYTEVFLSHARIYVFAEKYDIQPLKTLAIQRLHQTLKVFLLHPGRVPDITSLIRYVYSNTQDSENGSEPMRAMLLHYIGSEMEILVKSEEFKKFIEEGGPFVGDFLGIVARSIRSQ